MAKDELLDHVGVINQLGVNQTSDRPRVWSSPQDGPQLADQG
jgi:hypothetical protein